MTKRLIDIDDELLVGARAALGTRGIADTVRRYWIFVPAQYTGEHPANLLVFQDGHRAIFPNGELSVPRVLENLIAQKDIPVTIGVFVTPGQTGDVYPDDIGLGNPNHRAEEYDALSDTYARFLIEELLPEIGQRYRLSDDPARCAIGGTSSGAICAFTVAWHRRTRRFWVRPITSRSTSSSRSGLAVRSS